MNNPLISIITVSYNAVTTIEQTILSVVNQTYPYIEYIIIDGGSTDGTVDIIKKYAEKIAYWVSEPDKGIYDAMNKGVAVATGEWINFMNSGDEFPQDQVLQSVFTNKENTRLEVGVIYGDRICAFSFGKYYQPCHPLICMDTYFPFCHQSAWVRHSLVVSHLFDTSYELAADYHQLYTLYKENCVFQYVPCALSVFDSESGVSSLQSNYLKMHIEVARILNIKVPLKVYFSVMLCWVKEPAKKLVKKIYPAYFSAEKREKRLLRRDNNLSKIEEKTV
ncbi:glycosyltransferase family 2 protein [Phocaeicola sartorii]|uniref:glycosyltransferase family 2 protein n=1 Tax=Phocaeicola sartorii TaxID=671267 RepID=UPI002670728A|nr:glycosyltransferase family 2 protein [Phocaeicola sartorii]